MPEKKESKTPNVSYQVRAVSAPDAKTVEAVLNEMGADGWELVALRQVGFASDLYIFKRISGNP